VVHIDLSQQALLYRGPAKGRSVLALFGWLVASQPAVLFSHISSAPVTSHQPASSIFLSQ
jgi:hypothetical protein